MTKTDADKRHFFQVMAVFFKTMIMLYTALCLLLGLAPSEGFSTTVTKSWGSSSFVHRVPTKHHHTRDLLRFMTTDDGSQEDEEEDVNPSIVPVPEKPIPKRLDPLVASLTRMDEETANAKTMSVPLWGEVILDKSLFVFLPVAAFAILGLGLSVYIAFNSQDQLSQAVEQVQQVTQDYNLAGAKPPEIDPDACRGICSSQQEDLQDLANFMGRLAK